MTKIYNSIVIINNKPKLLSYGVPQIWNTLQFQLHTLTHKQNKKFQLPPTSDFPKSISTPAGVFFNSKNYIVIY